MKLKEMVEKFQCPGCVCGSDTSCGKYKLGPGEEECGIGSCDGHIPGTLLYPGGKIMLGFPKGFNKVGEECPIQLHTKESSPEGWDELNVPVWGMEEDGFLFIRSYSPRVNRGRVLVFEGRKFKDKKYPSPVAPFTINVKDFLDDID